MNYSIIIPHYSKTDITLLNRAITSIPQREDIEVIVVDNSPIELSFDNIKKPFVHVFFSDNKKGAGHARNVGLEHANGKWCLFLDADDFFTEDAFKFLDNYLYSDADIIFNKFCSRYSDTLKIADRDYFFNALIDDYLVTGNDTYIRYSFATPCSKMIKLNFIRTNNIKFEEIHAGNDVMFSVMSGYYAKKIIVTNNIIYCATVTRSSLTNQITKENFLDRFGAKIRLNDFLVEHNVRPIASLASSLLMSIKYGLKCFIYVLKVTISHGYLFVGKDRWCNTIRRKRGRKIQ